MPDAEKRNPAYPILAEHKLDTPVYFLPRRLHADPKELAEYLQNTIDSFDNVDRILICVSGCGGGTAKLRATTAELVIPKTRDCLDLLLSGDGQIKSTGGGACNT